MANLKYNLLAWLSVLTQYEEKKNALFTVSSLLLMYDAQKCMPKILIVAIVLRPLLLALSFLPLALRPPTAGPQKPAAGP